MGSTATRARPAREPEQMAIDDHGGSVMPNDQHVSEAPKETTGPLPAADPTLGPASRWSPDADGSEARGQASRLGRPRLTPRVAQTLFEIAVATMWSDGELTTAEVERGRATARVMRLNPRGAGAFGAIAAGALPFTEIDFDVLDPSLRDVAFATAVWIDEASEDASQRRTGFLRVLATRLDIGDDAVDELREAVRAVDRDNDAPEAAFAALLLALVPAATRPRLD